MCACMYVHLVSLVVVCVVYTEKIPRNLFFKTFHTIIDNTVQKLFEEIGKMLVVLPCLRCSLRDLRLCWIGKVFFGSAYFEEEQAD